MPQFTTPPGRLVWGHPLKMTPKLGDDNKPIIDPATNQPVLITSFGVAFPKDVFQQFMIPKIMETVNAVYPGGAPPHFAWKLSDGDASVGHRKGKPFNQREGYPGHMVMKFETNFAINAFRQNGAAWDQITAAQFKTGDIIAVGCNLEAHKEKQGQPRSTPGLYTNPNGVLHIADGPAIVSGPDAQTMFGGQQFQIPQGYSAPGQGGPSGNVNPPGMGMPGQGYAPPQQQPAQPMPGQAPGYGQQQPPHYAAPPQQQPAPQYQPAYDFVQGQPQQQYGQAPAPQYAPPVQQQQAMPGNGYAPTPGAPASIPGVQGQGYGQPGAQSAAMTYPSNQPQPMPGQMPGFPQR